ncbi:alpha/beta fold hydrolase [Actinospica durhamensis]|uniref:Alpha/beta fold hydrolase n=1 Tax=Actinospica durhamensis TaxID=1508375 RepID=A0A941ITT6_9ACTN|nr:alpha/beta fold hydrolase [Actinospica durhamensis]MBR7838077.1 alpha/beta fold hydrolase [Actinospica durhamensis]
MSDAAPETLEPLTVTYGAHPSQYFHVHLPQGPGPHPVVVLIHGGFWRLPYGLGLMRPLAEDLVRRGFAAVNVEYRRLGEKGGGWPGTCEDVLSAVRGLGTGPLPFDLRRIGIVGHSAGGHLALWVASALAGQGAGRGATSGAGADAESGGAGDEALASEYAIVSLAGVVDMRAAANDRLDEEHGKPPAAVEFMGGTPLERPDAYRLAAPIELLPLGPTVTQLVVHGDEDNRVPISQSIDYVRAALAVDDRVELARFASMGHFEVLEPDHESWLASVGFLTATMLG